MIKTRKKLIEVALPLVAINEASAREKSIRHGHPSTLHLWWARRPLAAARAVIFAQMVDDPSSLPEQFPTKEAQDQERQRLFNLIEELVKWENTTNEKVLERARKEIWKSWRVACEDNKDHPQAKELFNPEKLPAFHDPFAGGGSLPLEAQRLGLEAYASDLNPVAVLINKAMIEIPPKFAGQPPVNPEARNNPAFFGRTWKGAEGLAEDVRYYGKWMRDEAEKRIGHLYPKVKVTAEMVKERPDLKHYLNRELTVIAWLWARTVKSPNPAYSDVSVPLISTFILSKKKGKEAYILPEVNGKSFKFTIKSGKPKNSLDIASGTKLSRANFRCLVSGSPISGEYIKQEAKAGRMETCLIAMVAEGTRERIYLSPNRNMEELALRVSTTWEPDICISGSTQYLGVKPYGIERFSQLFTSRQLVALDTFSMIAKDIKKEIVRDGTSISINLNTNELDDDYENALSEYSNAISLYLAFAIDKGANYWSTSCAWHQTRDGIVSTFGRQAIPMIWDYAEANPFSDSSGNVMLGIIQAVKMIRNLGKGKKGYTSQENAALQNISIDKIVSTDPPYFDNVPYADLSDFFFIWLRSSQRSVYPELFKTLTTPKNEELVAFAYRHAGKEGAQKFFLDGMTQAMRKLANQSHPAYPVTIYYAFRQSENDKSKGTFSTGWDTFLGAVIRAGFSIRGTWPVRTEYTGNLKSKRNALASSIVITCRKYTYKSPVATRREFVSKLKNELPFAILHLQAGNIAPVDLAQSAIGPGMAIFTRFDKIIEADDSTMTVRTALKLINEVLDEYLSEQEGHFDSDTRFATTWFENYMFDEAQYGDAEVLATARAVSVQGIVEAGIILATAGKVRLLKRSELPDDWDPTKDKRLTVWEATQHLIKRQTEHGETAAADLLARLGSTANQARDLAYRLYQICERKGWAEEARVYNGLVIAWPELERLSQKQIAKPKDDLRLNI